MKRSAALILMTLALFGCSPQARVNRIVARHPELVRVDTIIKQLAVAIPEAKAETLFRDRPGDTVRITSDRLEMEYVRIHDTVHLRGRCKADTLRICDTVLVPRVKVILPPPGGKAVPGLLLRAGAAAALMLLIVFLVKKFT